MRNLLVIAILGLALVGLLPAAQGALPKVKLVSCVNTASTNEPGALNRCKNGRWMRYDFMEVTDSAVYTTDEGDGLEVWPVSADGKLSQGACFKAYADRDTCTRLPDPFNPGAIAASPDGGHLYVANSHNGISIFDIGADGALTYKDCMGAAGGEGSCSKRFPGEGSGIFQLRVSPDGERLYGFDYRGTVTFQRLPSGLLAHLGCLKLTKSVCAANQNYSFTADHAGVAVSPDSRFVYVVGGDSSESYKVKGTPVQVVSVLARSDSAPGVRLVQVSKLPVWGTEREGRHSAAVSPDGRHLYAVAKNRLVTFARNKQNGTVRLVDCIGEDDYGSDTRKCRGIEAPGFSQLNEVAVTRDGRGLAVSGSDGISFFKRNATSGALGARKGRRVAPQACAKLRDSACKTDLPLDFGPSRIAFSKRGRLYSTMWVQQVLASMTTPFGGGAARTTSASAAVEHRLGINNWMAGVSRSQVKQIYRGAEIKPLKFAVGLDLISEHGVAEGTTETVRMTLPKGLSWGSRAAWNRTMRGGVPDYWSFTPQTQSCTVEGQVATCQAVGVPRGTALFGWILDVEATAAGTYTIRGEVVPPADGRNRVPRGASTPPSADLNLIVGERSGAVIVSKVSLYRPPSRPSYVYASVEIKQGGIPTRADSVSCGGSFDGPARAQKLHPSFLRVLAPLGRVTCPHVFNNARYSGKVLGGVMEFTVGKTKVTRKYSVRIGAGTSLSAARGAVITTKAPF